MRRNRFEGNLLGSIRYLPKMLFALMMIVVSTSSIPASGDDPELFTLDRSIKYALEHSKVMMAAEERVKSAEAKLMKTRANLLPKISTNATYLYNGKLPKVTLEMPISALPTQGMPMPSPAPTYEQPSFPGTGLDLSGLGAGFGSREMTFTMGAKKNFQAGAMAQQTLFAGGTIYNSIKQAQLTLEAAKMDREATRERLIYDVKEAFYGVLLAEKFLEVSRRALQQAEKHYDTSKRLVETGTATKYDLLRAQVQLANVKSQLIKAQNTLRLAEERFKMTIGFEGPGEVKVKGEFREEKAKFDLNELIGRALEKRPDLKAMRLQVEATKRLISIAKGSFLPTISLVGNYGYLDNEKQEGQTTWSVTLRADLPLFTGFSRKASLKEAESAVNQVRLTMQQLEEGIVLEVKAAYLSFEEAKSLLEAQREMVQQAKEGLRMANLQYENGLITSVQLTDAELALTQAELSYYQALHDYTMAIAKIKKAVGEE